MGVLRHTAEQRQRLLAAASELRGMRARWTVLLQARLNRLRKQTRPDGGGGRAPLLFRAEKKPVLHVAPFVFPVAVMPPVVSLGNPRHVAPHVADLITVLDALRAEEADADRRDASSGNALAALGGAGRLPWPECLPVGLIETPALHAYLDAWANGAAL